MPRLTMQSRGNLNDQLGLAARLSSRRSRWHAQLTRASPCPPVSIAALRAYVAWAVESENENAHEGITTQELGATWQFAKLV